MKKPQLLFKALMIIILILQTIILYKQTGIIENASIPNFADINIRLYHPSMGSLSSDFAARKIPHLCKYKLCDNDQGPEYLTFYIQNTGRINTGPIKIWVDSYQLNIEKLEYDIIPNLFLIEDLTYSEIKNIEIVVSGNNPFCEIEGDSNVKIIVTYTCIYCTKHKVEKQFIVKVR